MPRAKKTVEPVEAGEVEFDETNVTATVEESSLEVPAAAVAEEEVLDTRNGFYLIRKGSQYGVKQGSLLIAPLGDQAEAEQLFRGMTRKF
jgi:hypothetical protein